MTKGKFGLPRPLAETNEFLTIAIDAPKKINEATVSAANGFVIQGEINPFFEVESVTHDKIGGVVPDTTTNVRIEVNDRFISINDIRIFIAKLNRLEDFSIQIWDAYIVPTIKVQRILVDEGNTDPFLLLKMNSNRISTEEEAENELKKAVPNDPQISLLEIDDDGRGVTVFLLSEVANLSDLSSLEGDFGGPRNKSTADLDISVISIDIGELQAEKI